MTDQLTVCGLFEWELVEKGIMKVGRCRDCFHNGSYHTKGEIVWICEKNNEKLDDELNDCPEWTIDTR